MGNDKQGGQKRRTGPLIKIFREDEPYVCIILIY